MGLYDRFATDAASEEQGQWVDFGDGVELRIASTASRRADRALDRHRAQYHRHYLHGKSIPLEVRLEADLALAAAVLTDWRGAGVTGPDGSPLPYSADAARQLMTDLRELREQVLFVARQAETFRKERVQDLGKTSSPSSGSTGSTPTGPTN
ncbi:MAG: hypothetical protein AB7G23_19230 [Vicinamibacterales bacterium]